MTLLVDLHDIRYVGDWGKKSDEAKRWGFMLANTAGYWLCFSQPLVKKLATASIVNIPDPGWNALSMIVVYWIDLILGLCVRGHRDHLINFSGAFVAVGNLCSLIMVCVKVLVPAMQLPQWLQGPAILILTAAMTAVCGVAALIDPMVAVMSSGSRLVRTILDSGSCLAALQPVLSLLGALRASLVSRFQRIFFSRSKQAMKQELMKDNAQKIEDYAVILRMFRLWRQNLRDTAICSECGREAETEMEIRELGFRRCSVCKFAMYCSQECQEKHQNLHRRICQSTVASTLKLLSRYAADMKQGKPTENDTHQGSEYNVTADIIALSSAGGCMPDTAVEKEDKDEGGIRKSDKGSVHRHDHRHDELNDDSSDSSAHSVYSAASDASPAKSSEASAANLLAPGFFARRARDSGSTKFGSFKTPSSAKFGSFKAPGEGSKTGLLPAVSLSR